MLSEHRMENASVNSDVGWGAPDTPPEGTLSGASEGDDMSSGDSLTDDGSASMVSEELDDEIVDVPLHAARCVSWLGVDEG